MTNTKTNTIVNIDNAIDKDDLTLTAANLEGMEYIIQAIQEDFFEAYNPKKSEDVPLLLYYFERYRSYMTILETVYISIKNDFKTNGLL